MECVLLVMLVIALSVFGAAARIAFEGWRSRERWGEVLSVRPAGSGADRVGIIHERRLRGVPWTVWVSGVVGAGLGPLTGLVFAPSGLLGALALGNKTAWLAAITLLASVSGFGLAVGLYRSAQAVLTCETGGAVIARTIAIWSAVHHATIAAVYLTLVSHESAAWMAVVPAVLGLCHAGLLATAASRVRAIQAAMSEQERAMLVDPVQEEAELRLSGLVPTSRGE